MKTKTTSASWQHLGAYSRFKAEPSEIFTRTYYGGIIERSRPLYAACCRVNLAHVVMLIEENIIDRKLGAKILQVMIEMDRMGESAFPFKEGRGNLYLNLESYLNDVLGEDVGGWAYIGRSRLDYEAAIRRVFVRDQLLNAAAGILKLIDTILRRAEEHAVTLMPGYSHMQQSQPCTVGHYLLSFADAFYLDLDRFKHAFRGTNISPLGAAAAAGELLPLNRKRTATLLGFDGFIENARSACFSRDYALEAFSAATIFMSTLSQLATDLDVFCTREFNLIELDDTVAGTSSFMPQKKNPLPLEAVRASSGYFIGILPSLLGVLKTHSEEVDIIEFTPDFHFNAFRILMDMIDLMDETVATLKINAAVMRHTVESNWSAASALAELISRECRLSWRTGHRIVGRLVRQATEQGVTPQQVTQELLAEAALEILAKPLPGRISTAKIRSSLDPAVFIKTRTTPGSTHPDAVMTMTQSRKVRLTAEKRWLSQKTKKIDTAYRRLQNTAARVAAPD